MGSDYPAYGKRVDVLADLMGVGIRAD